MLALRDGEPFLVPFEEKTVIDALWQFLLIVGDVDQCHYRIFAVLIDERFHHTAVFVVKTV